jgi:hypothetical protein
MNGWIKQPHSSSPPVIIASSFSFRISCKSDADYLSVFSPEKKRKERNKELGASPQQESFHCFFKQVWFIICLFLRPIAFELAASPLEVTTNSHST